MGGYQFVCGWSHPSLCGSILPCSVCYQNCNLRAGDTWVLLNPVHDQRYEEQPCFAVLCLGELCPAAVDWQLFWDLSVTIDTTLSGTEPTCPEEIGKDDLESNWWPGSCPLGLAGSPPAKGLSLWWREGPATLWRGPVTLWVCRQNLLSPWDTAPAVFCVGTPANGLLKGLGSLFELLVVFSEEDGVGDTTKRMKALMWEWFFFFFFKRCNLNVFTLHCLEK